METGSASFDVPEAGRQCVREDHERAELCGELEKSGSGTGRLLGMRIERCHPAGLRHVKRVMADVAQKDGGPACRFDQNAHVSRRVSRCRQQSHFGRQQLAAGDEDQLTEAVEKDDVLTELVHVAGFAVEPLPVAPADQVTCVRKRRDTNSVARPCIAFDVIAVGVCG